METSVGIVDILANILTEGLSDRDVTSVPQYSLNKLIYLLTIISSFFCYYISLLPNI
jgi:hypothetical protein